MSRDKAYYQCVDCGANVWKTSSRCFPCYAKSRITGNAQMDVVVCACGAPCRRKSGRCRSCGNRERYANSPDLRRPQEWWDNVIEMADAGLPYSEIAGKLGVTKNTIIGGLNRRNYRRKHVWDGLTTMDRLQLMHDKMDEALAEWNAR